MPVCHGTQKRPTNTPSCDRNFDLTPIYRAATSRRHTRLSALSLSLPLFFLFLLRLIVSKVRRSRSLRQWPAVPRPSSSLSSPPSVSPFSSSSSNRQSLARRWTRDKYRRHGIGASSFFPASSANTTTGLAREGQIRFFHPLGFLFLFFPSFLFSFFFFVERRGRRRKSSISSVERCPGEAEERG